jgi:transposase-like protein
MKKQPKTDEPSLMQIGEWSDGDARAYLESIRWPDGAVCPHCGSREVTALQGKVARPGLWKCRAKPCRKQFTVTVGTLFHRSKVPLRLWIMAFRLVCSSKKGISALQLKRDLQLGSYETAWHLAHRIRHAMANEPMRGLLMGKVEVDETWIGGKPRPVVVPGKKLFRTGAQKKVPVVALVERGGPMRAHYVANVTAKTLREAIIRNVAGSARLNTDQGTGYEPIARTWRGGHESVNHEREYAKPGRDGDTVHVNSCESWFALMKRGIHGAYHHVSRQHLQRYCDEFSFRWNTRGLTDGQRVRAALQSSDGVRLTYGLARA